MIKITLPLSQWDTFSSDILQGSARRAKNSFIAMFGSYQYTVRQGEPYGYYIQGDSIYQICNEDLITKDKIWSIVAAGGEVEDYFLAVEMTPTKFAGNVPNTIPNYQITNDDGTTTTLKWNEWVGNNTVVDNTNDKKMFQLWGCTASQAKSLDGLTGYTILTKSEYKSLVPPSSE